MYQLMIRDYECHLPIRLIHLTALKQVISRTHHKKYLQPLLPTRLLLPLHTLLRLIGRYTPGYRRDERFVGEGEVLASASEGC